MSHHRLALRSFPRNWRRRYGEELFATLEETAGERSSLQTSIDIVRAGMTERLRRLRSRRLVVLGVASLLLLAAIGILVGLQLASSTTQPTTGANAKCPIKLSLTDAGTLPPAGNWTITVHANCSIDVNGVAVARPHPMVPYHMMFTPQTAPFSG